MAAGTLPGIYLQVDARVFAFSMGVSLLSALAFGIIPALQATRMNVGENLKDGIPNLAGGAAIAAIAEWLTGKPGRARYGFARGLRFVTAEFSESRKVTDRIRSTQCFDRHRSVTHCRLRRVHRPGAAHATRNGKNAIDAGCRVW